MSNYKIYEGNCINILSAIENRIDLTFLDPPFNQNKEYKLHNDNLSDEDYWQLMFDVCKKIYELTSNGGSIYFMQREKNTEYVLKCLRESGWTLQNLIIWKKKTSAVPCSNKYGKHYQIIAFASKGDRPKTFNKLRISPPLPPNYKNGYENGIYVTDVWDDIRELTSGYFAGDEAIRSKNGNRFHKQQSPVHLLLRIILSSSNIGDTILDPFAGTGTTLVVSNQLQRNSVGIEIDPDNAKCINNRIKNIRESDNINNYYTYYIHTENLNDIWNNNGLTLANKNKKQTLLPLELHKRAGIQPLFQ
ncbi:MAG: modification methylase [Candidatus Altiarchaeales archaeon HGW-Altiarchaeales-1]|nr:MAG: modification methylase [Candidatus Altiarchaeales archaeon HGW-Altiarchaeales-1]